jgi:hypothetical protein
MIPELNDLRIATVEVSHLFGIPGSLEVSLLSLPPPI